MNGSKIIYKFQPFLKYKRAHYLFNRVYLLVNVDHFFMNLLTPQLTKKNNKPLYLTIKFKFDTLSKEKQVWNRETTMMRKTTKMKL